VRWYERIGPGLNWQLIIPVVSGGLLAVGIGMFACFLVAVIGGDGGTLAFGLPAAATIPLSAFGVLSARRLGGLAVVRARDGFFAVTMTWLAAALLGCVPFLIDGTYQRFGDALFESMSGFTTTGASLLARIEDTPDALLMWRSISQWLGGVGIVVLVVAIAPATGLATQRVFYAEITGVTAERLTPRIADTAKIIISIYATLTVLGLAAYWIAGMSLWEAVNHGLTTVATGGFSTRSASLGAFDSVAIEVVAIVFMAAGGINFAFYWLVLRSPERLWPQAAEVRAYVVVLLIGTAIATVVLTSDEELPFWEALRDAGFTVTSVVTSTGFITADFNEWHDFGRLLLLLLMFIGGCAGSTAGGMKVIRVMLLAKTATQEIQRQLRPRAVQVLRVRGRVYSEDVRRGVLGFFFIYVTAFMIGTLVMASIGLDTLTAASSTATTLNVIGPGLGDIGATESFQEVPESGRWILTFLMLAGRLEIFTVLVLLTPAFWRRTTA
jgi:trk system potassium uptake protein TrkH